MSSVLDGSSRKLLLEYMGSTRFPIVNTLYVTINVYNILFLGSKESAVTNINAFALFLRSLVPATAAVKLVCIREYELLGIDETTIGVLYEGYFSTFAKALYMDAKHAILSLNDVDFYHWSTIDAIPMLSRLELDCLMSTDIHTALVIKASPILQYLAIGINNASTLLQDGNGRDVTYPNLQYLQMYYCDGANLNGTRGTSNPVVFPVLKCLKLSPVYPFADDVVFRGNSATLEYLNISMDRGVVEMLHVNGVFESNRKALKVVVVREIDNHQDISLTSKAILSKFLHCFSRHAQYMTLLPSLLTSFPMPGSKYGDSFTNVQVLDMSSRALSFFEILRLLKTFPILRKLVCCIDGLGIEFEHIPENKVPDYIVATHRDIGKSLQIWCMSGFNGQSSCDILEYIMLLALVCPKFYRADVNLGLIPNYNARLSAALESGPYSKYSPRLAGLLMREM